MFGAKFEEDVPFHVALDDKETNELQQMNG